MLSHDLARMLLAHRNNDLRISVLNISADEDDERVVEKVTSLRDDRWVQDDQRTTAEGVLRYDAKSDTLHILAGYVVASLDMTADEVS